MFRNNHVRRLFVCPNSSSRMPYLKGYEAAIRKSGSLLIVWDRFHSEAPRSNVIIFRDKKRGMGRGAVDYFKFFLFVCRHAPLRPKSVVFFSSQIFVLCFLRFVFAKKMYLDVRDWHPVFNYAPKFAKTKLTKIFVSSIGFSSLLDVPEEKVVLSHNCWKFSRCAVPFRRMEPLRISYIGSVRDKKINEELIAQVANVPGVELCFHGDGYVAETLKDQVLKDGINNVYFHGPYRPEDEGRIYSEATVVSSLISSDSVNDKVLLTNRLYNAALYNRPLLVLNGNYLAEVVKKYNLGVCLNRFEGLLGKIYEYLSYTSSDEFSKRCDEFISSVEDDMKVFYSAVDEI